MTATLPATLVLLGGQHPTRLPSFGVREDLCLRWGDLGPAGGVPALRVYAAAVGLCSGLGAAARADLGRLHYDLAAYGDAVYSWLREQGATPGDIVREAGRVLPALAASVFPREAEVAEAAGFSPGGEAPPTSPPSDSASDTAPATSDGSPG